MHNAATAERHVVYRARNRALARGRVPHADVTRDEGFFVLFPSIVVLYRPHEVERKAAGFDLHGYVAAAARRGRTTGARAGVTEAAFVL